MFGIDFKFSLSLDKEKPTLLISIYIWKFRLDVGLNLYYDNKDIRKFVKRGKHGKAN